MENGLRILLIDDDEDYRELVRQLLIKTCQDVVIREAGYAADGIKALSEEDFHCAIVEQNLPDGSGLEIIQHARNNQIRTPIVMLTGHSDEQLIVEVMRSGGSDYLPKNGLLPETLCHCINNAIRLEKIENERERAIEALNKGERLTDAIVASAVDAIISIDAQGLIESLNPATTSIFGYEKEELIGRNINCLMPKTIAKKHDEYLSKYCHSGKSKIINVGPREINGRHKDGSVINIELAVSEFNVADKKYFLGIIRDVRLRKRMQETIANNEERLRYSQELSGLGIWDLNLESGELYWSEQVAGIFGLPPSENNKTLDDLLSRIFPKDLADVTQAINNCLDKELEFDIEHRIVWPDNSVHWVEGRGGVIQGADNRPVRMVCTVMDITDRKESDAILSDTLNQLRTMNVQIKEAQDQLLQSEKMASIGQLAAGVAHEINNPIGYISSNVGSLKQYIDDLFKLAEAYEDVVLNNANESSIINIQKIKNEIDIEYLRSDLLELIAESEEGVVRVKQIVQDLKDFSHAEEAEWQWANIHKGINSTLNVVCNEIKYKADVIKEYGDVPDIECIISQLNQVFMNLLVNASHAIDDKSRGTITIRTYPEDEGVVVSIEDTGKGMTKETAGKIFDPFFTTKPIGKGTGLGLSLSYGIISKHNGTITVASEVGKGTLFKIWLPITQNKEMAD